MTDLSKITKFPFSYGQPDIYFIYTKTEEELSEYLNNWFSGEYLLSKDGSRVYTDDLITVKKCDTDTKYHLHNHEINSVNISIHCPIGLKFTQNENGEDLYDMIAIINSIDDMCYNIWFSKLTLDYLKDARLKLVEWIDSCDLLNGDAFINKCIELGANEKQIYYS